MDYRIRLVKLLRTPAELKVIEGIEAEVAAAEYGIPRTSFLDEVPSTKSEVDRTYDAFCEATPFDEDYQAKFDAWNTAVRAQYIGTPIEEIEF